MLLTAAAYRRRFDGARGSQVSRFVDEIPATLLVREGMAATSYARESAGWSGSGSMSGGRARWGGSGAPRSRDWDESRGRQYDEAADVSFDHDDVPGGPSHGVTVAARSSATRSVVGKRVHHEKFGYGTVLDAEGVGADMKLTVRFTSDIKKVFARFVTGVDDGDHA